MEKKQTPKKFELLGHLLQNGPPGHGSAQILPWYHKGPTFYRGNRDTEPRSLLLAWVQIESASILFCCTQLTALKEENTDNGRQSVPQGIDTRRSQTDWIATYLQDYQNVRKEFSVTKDIVILVGDFNTEPGASELAPLEHVGLTMIPCSGNVSFTHRNHKILIDMVFVPKVVHNKSARIIDLSPLEQDPNKRISDHNPVTAKLELELEA